MAREAEDDYQEEQGWGTSKADYYDADVIETEQDALDEEAEARRLQQKQLAGLSEHDFGLDELLDEDVVDERAHGLDEDGAHTITEVLPQERLAQDLSPAERLKLLHSLYPEFDHLRKELVSLQPVFEAMQENTHKGKSSQARWLALSGYLGCLSMYFALLTSPASASSRKDSRNNTILAPQEVRSHPIMARLVKSRELWLRASQLQDDDTSEDAVEVHDTTLPEDDEVNGALQAPSEAINKRKRKKSRAERAAEAAAAEAAQDRLERIRKTQEDFADLPNQLKTTRRSAGSKAIAGIKPRTADQDSDFGDEDALTGEEAAEKARKKKSLRFYTSQIAQKANRRERKGLMAGGDDDIPHRERFRDRQARTMDNPEERYGRRQQASPGSEDESVDNDLTNLRPAAKKRRDGEGQEAGDKRSIGYEIEKNKGLTPFRKKDVRNPRVKKRKRYEDKKKKLGSRRAVWKGGEGKGGYGGERTGINTNVVKSVKL